MSFHEGGWSAGSFGDLWTYSDPESGAKRRGRDFHPFIAALYACQTCGAKRGEPCVRVMANGEKVIRRVHHFGRARPGRHVIYGRSRGDETGEK